MNPLQRIGLAIGRGVKWGFNLPQVIGKSAEQRRQQIARNEQEAERLDRICNPSKYQGK